MPALTLKTLFASLAVLGFLALPASAAAAVDFTATDPDSPANVNNPKVQGTADDDVVLYSDSACTNQLASGTEAELEGAGITINVADDSTTTIYGDDGSGCSTDSITYVEDSTAPAAPTVSSTDPASPANNNDPKVKGSAEAGTTVSLYTASDCSGTALATGTDSEFSGAGIAINVPDDSTTTIFATATDDAGNTSSCSTSSVEYVEDSTAQEPTLTGTDPSSPANNNDPKVKGTAEDGATVDLYTTADCSGTPVASGTAEDFSGAGIAVTVADDSTTVFHATATDAAGNTSVCSTSTVTYVEDSTAPAPPTVAATNPAGPANDNTPEVTGSAEAGSVVTIFAGDCAGTALGAGTAADFAAAGVSASVPDDSTTILRAKATDAAGNSSSCSTSSVSYTEDSTAPDTRVTFSPAGKTRDRTPTFLFSLRSDRENVTFVCSMDDGGFKPCESPKTYGRLSLGRHTFKVAAVDRAGNADPSAAARSFRVVRRPRNNRNPHRHPHRG
jgi:hypothetical protein